MNQLRTRWLNWLFPVLTLVLALGFTTIILLMTGAPPIAAFRSILEGGLGSISRITDVLVAWVPLLLVTMGLLVTFTAGLWNIGIEGQITLGAIFATAVLRALQDSTAPPWVIITAAILAGAVGGALWAALAGVLKTYGGVNEIFGGLGLDFVALALVLWLIFGPWKRPGIGSMSGTEPFPQSLWLPMFAGTRLSPWSLVIGLVSLVVVYFLLRGTYFGLKLKAVGRNKQAAGRIGVPTSLYLMLAFIVCGLFAGIAGSLQVTAVYHRLIPSISSNYGWIGLLVAMLVNYRAIPAALVALFFAFLNIGSIRLPIMLKLDSTLAGVIQGSLVLFALIANGLRQRINERQEGQS
ncbi:MAG: ABC transporter permease [Anaerolineales bacterium]